MVKKFLAEKWIDLSTEVKISDHDQVKVAKKNLKDLRDSYKNVTIFLKTNYIKSVFNPSLVPN